MSVFLQLPKNEMQRMIKKLIFTILFFFLASLSFSQPKEDKRIKFEADNLDYNQELLPNARRLIGNVIFSQDNIIGYCDSAYLYSNDNYLVAFGDKVRIHVNDSVTLYGRKVYYDGASRIASIARDVELINNDAVLYTDSLIYDLNTDEGSYLTGGKTVNKDNVLTSLQGRFYTKQNEILLNHDVLLVNDTYTMTCSSLKYNTTTKEVFFTSRTHLISDENEIFTTSGWYNTERDIALLVEDVEMFNATQTVFGDSIYYDKILGFGRGWNNVVVTDSEKGYVISSNYLEHYENGGVSVATDSAMLTLIDRGDSLFLHADTLKVYFDSLQEPQLMLAFPRTKFYRADMQGACDSLSFITQDSIVNMYYNPVVWTGENQLTADTIRFTMLDEDNIRVDLLKAGFIASSIFGETEFNQIKGATIIGYIFKKNLIRVDVINNAECLYYIQEQDSSLMAINSSSTSEMRILFENNEVKDIIFFNNPDGNIYPDDKIPDNDRQLKDFRWLNLYRPKTVPDIFVMPMNRVKVEETADSQSLDTNQ